MLPMPMRGAAFIAVCTMIPAMYVGVAGRLGAFSIARAEQRYAIVGQRLRTALPPDAVVMSMIQSGSVRWYGGRPTVRWDAIPRGRLDAVIESLEAAGYQPYILLEDWEDELFNKQFATNFYGTLEWPPVFEYLGYPRVRVYSTADRARQLAGERILTIPITEPD